LSPSTSPIWPGGVPDVSTYAGLSWSVCPGSAESSLCSQASSALGAVAGMDHSQCSFLL
jgi:hypothetical protein